jgi:hypothetical protein
MKKLFMILPLVFLLCFTFSCQKQVTEEVPEGITEEEAKAFMDATLEIWNEGNLDLVDEFRHCRHRCIQAMDYQYPSNIS